MSKPELEELIRLRYPADEWAVIFELSKGTGYAGQSGRIDAAVFNCWPSKGFHRLALEVKRSRGDFMRELEKPAKRMWVEENFHQTWFVVPAGLVKAEEVPESWGLLMATKDGTKLRKVKQAMHREIQSIPEPLALAAIRAVTKKMANLTNREITFEGETITQEDLQRRADKVLEAQSNNLIELAETNHKKSVALAKERRELIEPLSVLAHAVLGWDANKVVSTRGDEAVEITAEQVREWLGMADLARGRMNTQSITRARDALNELLGVES
jgi:hypothetical protein